MKRQACMLLCAGLLALGAGALAQTATYVFPYEGFRYTQREDETVLTQTNLGEHEALLKSLGTSSEAVLASYVASGIVMEVIPDDGGQIAVSVTDAGKFADVQDMDKMTQEQRHAFLAQFEMSGLYETCAYVDTAPACVRLTSSAMYASMPVYSLRYATLHLGKLYMIEQTIVGREPNEADDARMEQLLSGMKLLSSLGQPTPQATATMQPTATPEPILGSAAVETSGSLTLNEIPAYTTSAQLTLSGHAAASAEIRVEESGKQLAKTGAKKDGSFSLKVRLADEGDHELVVTAGEDTATFTIRYEKPDARLEITEPESTTFTGGSVTVRGVTEPNATVYIDGKGMNTNVKAGKNGGFSVRVFMSEAGTETFTLRAKADGFAQSTRSITLTREWTQRELIAQFRQKMIALDYDELAKKPAQYAQKRFILRGKVIQRELNKNRFSLDELMQELRNQGVLDISKIEYGILETDGRLNVILYASESPVTPAMLNIETSRDAYPAIIINDGLVMETNLRHLGRDMNWLTKQLNERGAHSPSDVFLMTLNKSGQIYYAAKEYGNEA